MRRDWWTPLTGAAFVVVLIVGFLVGGEPPDADDPVREIVEHYVDDKDAITIGAVLQVLAAALLVFFAGILRTALRAAEGERGGLSLIAFTGLAIVAVGASIDATLTFALTETADDVEPAAVQALQALWDNDFMPLALGTFLFLLSSGLSIVRNAPLPKWLGWAAIVLALAAVTPAGFVAFIGAALWILVVSVMLTMQARAAPA